MTKIQLRAKFPKIILNVAVCYLSCLALGKENLFQGNSSVGVGHSG
jgi:hypothetical protein